MCNVCGCSDGEVKIETGAGSNGHHHHHHGHHHHYGHGEAGVSVPGFSQSRLVQIEQDILAKNNDYAAATMPRSSK